MKSDDARRMLEAARKQAVEMQKAVSIVVVDTQGIPVALERVGDPAAFTTVVAEGKASAAAFTGRDSAQLQGMAERFPAMVTSLATRLGGRFMPVQGAVVLTDASGVVGAIGVSGATAEEDETIAKAGQAAQGG